MACISPPCSCKEYSTNDISQLALLQFKSAENPHMNTNGVHEKNTPKAYYTILFLFLIFNCINLLPGDFQEI